MILLIAVGAIVLGAIAFILTHRKKPAPAAGWTDDGTMMPVETDPPAMPEGPIGPVAPIEPPPPPAAPATPIAGDRPFPPEAPGAAIPPEDEPPPPPASD